MGEPCVVSALRDKRAEISGMIADLEKELSRQRADLAHLDATLRLFAPDLAPLWWANSVPLVGVKSLPQALQRNRGDPRLSGGIPSISGMRSADGPARRRYPANEPCGRPATLRPLPSTAHLK